MHWGITTVDFLELPLLVLEDRDLSRSSSVSPWLNPEIHDPNLAFLLLISLRLCSLSSPSTFSEPDSSVLAACSEWASKSLASGSGMVPKEN